jgi:hypothetical protein
MPAPGFLCVAASESLLRRTTTFGLEEIGGAFMYVKRMATDDMAAPSGVQRAS